MTHKCEEANECRFDLKCLNSVNCWFADTIEDRYRAALDDVEWDRIGFEQLREGKWTDDAT